jgi:hypothetical protein
MAWWLYASSRLYINFFQPSFKLKSKTRDGAQVHKVCFAPATPCDRLLAHDSVTPEIKEKLRRQLESLGPVRLLQEIRLVQQILSDLAAHGERAEETPAKTPDIDAFLKAWRRHGRTAKHAPPIASSPAPNTGGELGRIRSPTPGRRSRAG